MHSICLVAPMEDDRSKNKMTKRRPAVSMMRPNGQVVIARALTSTGSALSRTERGIPSPTLLEWDPKSCTSKDINGAQSCTRSPGDHRRMSLVLNSRAAIYGTLSANHDIPFDAMMMESSQIVVVEFFVRSISRGPASSKERGWIQQRGNIDSRVWYCRVRYRVQ